MKDFFSGLLSSISGTFFLLIILSPIIFFIFSNGKENDNQQKFRSTCENGDQAACIFYDGK